MLENDLDVYAREVSRGLIPAGKYHRLACERHLRDRARAGTRAFPYWFDERRVLRFYNFAQLLRHYKGEWAGQRIVLQPHQRFRLGSLFGWIDLRTNLRRFRTHYNELPRKSGKSLEAAVVALYATFFDGEAGAEGYVIATKREQALIVYNDARQLTESSGLRARLEVYVANLHRRETAAKLQPLGADRDSTDGLNPHVVIIDEAHAMKSRRLIDVMETALGARRQPILFWITTAGSNLVSPCGDQHLYATKILEQVVPDESFFAFIAHADAGDDWRLESTHRKANPSFGVSVSPAEMAALALKAIHIPAAAAAFRQKNLNEWVNADAPWLSLDGWRKGQTTWTAAELAGRRCYVGIDLSSKIDLTAVVAAFPPEQPGERWRLLPWCLTPAETLEDRAHRDRAPYLEWVQQKFLYTNPGNRIDQALVRERVAELRSRYDVQGIAIDPWNAGNLQHELEGDGCKVIAVDQTMKQMSQPSKEWEADVLDGLIDAGGHPLFAWCISNVVVDRDGKDNIFPIKKRSRGRIDPVIAALLARKIAMLPEPAPPQFQMLFLGGPRP